jgi:putative intracellular protease/amidase
MRILIVLTSHDQLGNTGEKTGFWLEELAAPYYVFKEAEAEITLASPQGGPAPLDPKSDDPTAQTDATRRFRQDRDALEALANTLPLSSVSASDFDAIFYPGGHGPLWDLAEDLISAALIESFSTSGKPVSAVCHAPAVFRHAKHSAGKPLVSGRRVTGFTNSEEEAVGLSAVVPFSVEDMLKANGARFERGPDWQPYVVRDGTLITGQNPASSEAVARAVLAVLRA